MTATKRPPEIEKLLAVLVRHDVHFVLIGSVAAGLYGVEVEPGDLDIAPNLDRENLRRLAAVLEEIDAALDPEAPAGHWDVGADGERRWVAEELTPENVTARKNWAPNPDDLRSLDHLFMSRYGRFDVVPELMGSYEGLKARATRKTAFGHQVWVAHVDDLLTSLTVPRRRKDAKRVRQLRAIQRRRSLQ